MGPDKVAAHVFAGGRTKKLLHLLAAPLHVRTPALRNRHVHATDRAARLAGRQSDTAACSAPRTAERASVGLISSVRRTEHVRFEENELFQCGLSPTLTFVDTSGKTVLKCI